MESYSILIWLIFPYILSSIDSLRRRGMMAGPWDEVMRMRWTPNPSDLAAYERDGFVVVRQLLNNTEVRKFQLAVDAAVARAWPKDGKLKGYQTVFIQLEQVWQTDQDLRPLSLDPGIARAAAALMRTAPIRVFLNQVIYKQPGGLPTVPHQDAPYLGFDDSRSVNCWIALDKTTEYNGAIEYFRGSQALGRLRLVELDRLERLIDEIPQLANFAIDRVEAEPGNAVFHNCLVVHQAFPNVTMAPRRAFSVQYMPASARFNGEMHSFMEQYHPKVGDALDLPCFPIVGS